MQMRGGERKRKRKNKTGAKTERKRKGEEEEEAEIEVKAHIPRRRGRDRHVGERRPLRIPPTSFPLCSETGWVSEAGQGLGREGPGG